MICVVKPEPGQSKIKEVSSTEGMSLSLKTSSLMEYARLGANLPEQHINQLITALNEQDFKKFAKIVIKESN